MKKFIYALLILLASSTFTFSQTYTWTNGGGDNSYENPLNWNPTPPFNYPTFGETALFDGAVSNAPCIMAVDNDVTTITMNAAYTGTVDASAILLNITNASFQGGTFISCTTTLEVSGNLNKGAGSVFSMTPTGVVVCRLSSTTARNIIGSFNFSNLVISSFGSGNRIISLGANTSTCTNLALSANANPLALRGGINVTSVLDIQGTATTAAASNTANITFIGTGAKTINGAASAGQNPIGNIIFNTTGAVSMNGNITIAQSNSGAALTPGNWSITNIGSFTEGNSTVTMCGTITANSSTAAVHQAYFDNLAVTTNSTLVFAGASRVNVAKNLTNNGTLTTNTSLLRLNGTSGSQTIGGSAPTTTLNAVEALGSTGKTFSSATQILDSLKISSAVAVNSGGNLTFPATSTLKARIAEIASGGSLNGNITVQTFAPGGTTDWAVLGVTGVQGQNLSSWDGQFPITCNGCINGTTTAGGNFASAVAWDESMPAGDPNAYVTMNNTDPLTPGKGFWIYLGTGPSSSSDITYNVTGNAVTGNVSFPVTNSGAANGDGYNLVSNPYACPISWDKVALSNPGINNATYIYSADLGLTTSYVGGVSSNGTSGANNVIPAGQGFYVQATSSGNLGFQESHKISNNTGANQLIRTSSQNQNIGTVLRLHVNGGGYSDETAIRFHQNATPNFDGALDAWKLFDSPGYLGFPGVWSARTTISTKDALNKDLSINSLPYPHTQNAVIPVLVRVLSTGVHTITASQLENLPPSACVLLKDKLTNTTHDLRTGGYVCTIADSTQSARFELKVCANGIIGINENTVDDNSVLIGTVADGAIVYLNFDKAAKTTISVTNILGQKVKEDVTLYAEKESVNIQLPSNNQVYFVTINNGSKTYTKKIVR
jgi:hypothetical protein